MGSDIWDDLAQEIYLTPSGGVVYTSHAKRIMALRRIDEDNLHAAIEDSSGEDQNGEEWIDWDAVRKVYAEIVEAQDAE